MDRVIQGVLIAVIILGSGYLVYSFVVPTSDTPEVTDVVVLVDDVEEIDTLSWQTYRNEEVGFSLKHPRTLTEIEPGSYLFCLQHEDELRLVQERCAFAVAVEDLESKPIDNWLLERDGYYPPGGGYSYKQKIAEFDGTYEWQSVGENQWLYVHDPEGIGYGRFSFYTQVPSADQIAIVDTGGIDNVSLSRTILSTFEFVK